jgi:hypothetical protein
MTQHKFRVQLLGRAGSDAAALKPLCDGVAVFHRKGRVPVKGTIDGFPFRSSLMNMGEGHMMVVNARLRTDAQCKAGDTVTVRMAVDEDERTVEVPGYLKKIIAGDPKARKFWPSFPAHIRRSMCRRSGTRKNRRPGKSVSPP